MLRSSSKRQGYDRVYYYDACFLCAGEQNIPLTAWASIWVDGGGLGWLRFSPEPHILIMICLDVLIVYISKINTGKLMLMHFYVSIGAMKVLFGLQDMEVVICYIIIVSLQ